MQHDVLIRCSSLCRIMTEPRTKAEGILSVGAKTYIRELAQQAIFGVDFEFSSKETEKGILVEQDSIDLLNRVRGLSLVKNTERRTNGLITGEADLYDAERKRGHDIKSAWSLKTFRGWREDCEDKVYEWQMRGYMMLWDADSWNVDYCMVEWSTESSDQILKEIAGHDYPMARYRIKPKTININGFDVPEPMRVMPNSEAYYFSADVNGDAYCNCYVWHDRDADKMFFKRGLVHATKEAAAAHGRALASFTEVKE